MVKKKKRRHIRPEIQRFVDGFLYGSGIALGLGIVGAITLMFLAAAFHYAVWH